MRLSAVLVLSNADTVTGSKNVHYVYITDVLLFIHCLKKKTTVM